MFGNAYDVDIHLVEIPDKGSGNGSISGEVTYESPDVYESEIYDATFIANWSGVSWDETEPSGTSLSLAFRSCDDILCDVETWSAWDGDSPNSLTSKFSVEQNYPNPFNPTTAINFTVAKAGNVYFTVFNVLAQEVFAAKINAVAGANNYQFNGVNLSSGLYFYQVQQGANTVTKKMVLMK